MLPKKGVGTPMQGSIRKRGNGRWEIQIYIGKDEKGRYRRRYFQFTGSKREAEVELRRRIRELESGVEHEKGKLTVIDYLNRYLGEREPSLRPKTMEGYRDSLRKHIAPALGHLRLKQLTPLHLQGYYREKLKTLSGQSVRHHHNLLARALKQAVRWGYLAANPAERVEPPVANPPEMRVLDAAALKIVLEAARSSRLYPAFLLAISAGLRRGEVLGLRWQDLDLESGLLQVRQTLVRVRGQGCLFQAPKTKKSRRPILLPEGVLAELRLVRQRQEDDRERLGPVFRAHGLVLCKEDGTPYAPESINDAWAALTANAGVERVRFHDLRHSCATYLLAKGVHPKIVADRLGHSTVKLTLYTYSHFVPHMQLEAAEYTDDLLAK
jgi:integrase